MQAIVKEQRAPGLTVTTVPKPSAGPGEVLIRVRHAGVCGTDLHIADWDAWAQGRLKPPLVVGHEFAGEIVALGDGVAELKVGQAVTAEGHLVCGHCVQCRTGNGHICRNTRIIGVDLDGAFAEYIAMPATNVLPLDGIPTTVGAVMDPMGNAFHTVLTADISGSTGFIGRCGPIGCFAGGIARAAGAAKGTGSDAIAPAGWPMPVRSSPTSFRSPRSTRPPLRSAQATRARSSWRSHDARNPARGRARPVQARRRVQAPELPGVAASR